MTKLLLLLLLPLTSAATVFAQNTGNSECARFEAFVGYSVERVDTESFNELESFAGLTAAQLTTNFGLSTAQANNGFRDAFRSGRNLRGLNVSAAKYLRKCLALVADFSYERSDETRTTANNPVFFEDTSQGRRRRYAFLVGPQLKFRPSRIEPFVHALFGGARQTNTTTLSIQSTGNPPATVATLRLRDDYTAFTAALGGGIDIPVSHHITIRAIQVDYIPVFTRQRDARLVAPTANGADGLSLGQTTFAGSRRDGLRISIGVVFR